MTEAELMLERNWARLEILCNDLLIQCLGDRDIFAQYQRMLSDLRHDRVIDGRTYLGMYRAPASKDRHHNCEGGLVIHLLEMWDLYAKMKPVLLSMCALHPSVNDQNVWRAILHHDLNKIWRYALIPDSPFPFAVEYSKIDGMTELLGSNSKALWFLQKYDIALSIMLYNALLASEGGYSQTRPPVETAFAKLIYVLDELSANVIDRHNRNRFWDSKEGGLSEQGQA